MANVQNTPAYTGSERRAILADRMPSRRSIGAEAAELPDLTECDIADRITLARRIGR